jgi:hypothetical protein
LLHQTTKAAAFAPEVDDRADMDVVTPEAASSLEVSGAFLFCSFALGHTYGVTKAEVQRLQAAGKVGKPWDHEGVGQGKRAGPYLTA